MTGLMPLVLLQGGSADFQRLLRANAPNLFLGELLLVAGLVFLVAWLGIRRRGSSLLWLGIFALVYGFRLLARTATFRLGFDVPAIVWDHIAAALTYAIPLPFVLLARSILPSRAWLWNWILVGMGAFVTGAIASDLILRQPDSANVPNSMLAVAFLVFLLARLFLAGLAPSRDRRTLRIGVLAWSMTAIADNLRGLRLVVFPGPDLEPFGFTILVACLGTLAVWRVLGDARRLVAIDRELNIARQIQSSILPQAMPRVGGFVLSARYRPMTAVAGDFYDFMGIDERRLGVLVADVSGHGVPAALIASMVKVALAAQHDRADHPAAVLAGMNEVLCGKLGGQYVTAAYLFLDGSGRLMRYAAAGHPPMLRMAGGDKSVQEIEKNGLVLGFMESASYEETEQTLEAGDRLLLYTDGLVEAANVADEPFGIDRVKSVLAEASALPPEMAANALTSAMDAWSQQPAADDLTIIVVDFSS